MPRLARKVALARMDGWQIVTSMLALILAMGISPECASAQSKPDPRVADLVQSGKLRVGLGVVAGHWAIKDPATG